MFDEYQIEATVCDPKVDMLARIDVGIRSHEGAHPEKWTTEDEAAKNAAWAKAYESQALKDARLIAALRNAAPDLLRIAEAVAEQSPSVAWDGTMDEKSGAYCRHCDGESYGPNPYHGQPNTNGTEAPESIAEWDAYRKQSDERAAALVAAIVHAPDCAWVLACNLMGGFGQAKTEAG